MKQFTKSALLAALLGMGVGLSAQTLDLHLECPQESKGCVILKDDKGVSYNLQEQAAFQFSEENVADVYETMSDFNQVQLAMKLKPEAGARFSDLTGANVGKVIAIVHEGQVITAPMIRDRINGSLTLTQGENDERAWQKIPWIKARVTEGKQSEGMAQKQQVAIYVTLALILIVGGVAFAFRRGAREQSKIN